MDLEQPVAKASAPSRLSPVSLDDKPPCAPTEDVGREVNVSPTNSNVRNDSVAEGGELSAVTDAPSTPSCDPTVVLACLRRPDASVADLAKACRSIVAACGTDKEGPSVWRAWAPLCLPVDEVTFV